MIRQPNERLLLVMLHTYAEAAVEDADMPDAVQIGEPQGQPQAAGELIQTPDGHGEHEHPERLAQELAFRVTSRSVKRHVRPIHQ